MRSDAFRAAAEAKDFASAPDLFTDDVSFRSPVVYKPYESRDALFVVLSTVLQVFENFHYVEQMETDDTAMLMFEATVDGKELQGIDILRFDEAGKIEELIVMVRPMSGMHALAERMRALLEAAA